MYSFFTKRDWINSLYTVSLIATSLVPVLLHTPTIFPMKVNTINHLPRPPPFTCYATSYDTASEAIFLSTYNFYKMRTGYALQHASENVFVVLRRIHTFDTGKYSFCGWHRYIKTILALGDTYTACPSRLNLKAILTPKIATMSAPAIPRLYL